MLLWRRTNAYHKAGTIVVQWVGEGEALVVDEVSNRST